MRMEKFNNALDMIFSVACDMGIITLMRKVESTSPKHDNESNYTYDYEIVMEVKNKPFKMWGLKLFFKILTKQSVMFGFFVHIFNWVILCSKLGILLLEIHITMM